MPKGGYFFDSIIRQEPIDESRLDPADNLEEFGLLSDEDLAYYREARDWFEARPRLRRDAGHARRGLRRHRAGAGPLPETPQGHPRRPGVVHLHGQRVATMSTRSSRSSARSPCRTSRR